MEENLEVAIRRKSLMDERQNLKVLLYVTAEVYESLNVYEMCFGVV